MNGRITSLSPMAQVVEREALWFGLAGFVLLTAAFHNGLAHMVSMWDTEEYSHAWIIPPLALLIGLSRLEGFTPRPGDGRSVGLVLLGAAFGLLAVGEVSGIYSIMNYGYLIGLTGLTWAALGTSGVWRLRGPLFYLVFMLPLPKMFYVALSAKMQLWSSELGVGLVRAAGVSVFLDGNIIDLGSYQLEVAEACNGLRYLFPLMSFGFLAAMLLDDALWKRIVLVLSTLPITLVMNSARIAMIGVLVDNYGIGMAEGAQHVVEGFVVFGLCVGVLLLEVWLLLHLPPRGGRFTALSVVMPKLDRLGSLGRQRAGTVLRSSVVLIGLGAVASIPLSQHQEAIPDRMPLSYFPMQVGTWNGRADTLSDVYLGVLKLTDYAMVDYRRAGDRAGVNFYAAYYDSQRYGVAAHSPQECIPGGGWTIDEFSPVTLPADKVGGTAMEVNRAVISRQGVRQVVYYWFDQRGRHVTNEYMVKGWILADALTRGRTDGAMIRLVSPINPGETEADADARLQDFVRAVRPHLDDYVPA